MSDTDSENLPSFRREKKSAGAFRTISEVADDLDLPQHVLRFWETKFPQVKPLKRGGGRRYYRPEDLDLLRRIRSLLYDDGYTIKGVQKLLRQLGVKAVVAGDANGLGDGNDDDDERGSEDGETAAGLDAGTRQELSALLSELKDIRSTLG
ncbi:MAG: MerR family transcriptional regulator [Magnetospiraceae bacterium]